MEPSRQARQERPGREASYKFDCCGGMNPGYILTSYCKR